MSEQLRDSMGMPILTVPADRVLRVHMTGPRNSWRTREALDKFPYIKLDVDMLGREVPTEGEIIILNDGGSYKVARRMYWVDTDEEAGWNEDVAGTGWLKGVHLDVLPSGWEDSQEARVEKLATARQEYEGALAAVHNLHQPRDLTIGQECMECGTRFPCATLRVIAPFETVVAADKAKDEERQRAAAEALARLMPKEAKGDG